MRTRSVLFSVVLLSVSACGDGKHHRDLEDGGDEAVTGEQADAGKVHADASPDLDGARELDGAAELDGSLPLDAAGDGATPADGSAFVDSATAVDGATPGQGLDGSALPDGALLSPDGQVQDGAVSADAGAADGAIHCDVNDPKYGCGVVSGSDWISFPDFEVDLKYNTAWTVPVAVADDDALFHLCPTLSNGGLSWDMPQTADARQLAAGCAKTVPGGSCQVYLDEVLTSQAGDCTCDPALVGPHDGKFCRPEVPECATLWVWTHTFETGFYQHWFYDVNTGSITPAEVAVGIANRAVGRCVHHLSAGELPTVTVP